MSVTINRTALDDSLPLCELRPGGGRHPLAGTGSCATFADYAVANSFQHTAEAPGAWSVCSTHLETAVSFELPDDDG